jgi:hypothetical protein
MNNEQKRQYHASIVLDRFREVHGDFYDYSKFVYNKSKDKGVVICRTHGEFLITPNDHSQGVGCKICGYERNKKNSSKSLETFILQAREVHGDRYDYTISEYINSRHKLKIICHLHGEFLQAPDKHLRGRGCPRCKADGSRIRHQKSFEYYVSKAKTTHDDRYTYIGLDREGSNSILIINCKNHGNFRQDVNNHISNKQGCPSCSTSGFVNKRRGNLYILVSGNVTKVGITNRRVDSRVVELNKASGMEFKLHSYYTYSIGQDCRDTERLVLQHLKANYNRYDRSHKFHGYSECFIDVPTEVITGIVESNPKHNKYNIAEVD